MLTSDFNLKKVGITYGFPSLTSVLLIIDCGILRRVRLKRTMPKNPKYKQDKKTGRFATSGLPTMSEKTIGIRLPKDVDEALRAMPNRTEFLRNLITEAVRKQKKAS